MFVIIDGHCHAGTADRLTAPWTTVAPLRAYLHRARAAGIQRTVLIPVGHSDYAIANRQVAQLVRAHPDRYIGFASVHARRDKGRVLPMVAEAVTRLGLRGLKVHRYDAPASREVCEVAQRFALPVLYDVVGQAHLIELVASQYPQVNFIVPHLGSFADDWRAHLQVIDHISRHPNVYADTSGVKRFDYLLQAVRRAGARKLIFGSDGPWLHPALELQKIRLLGLNPEDEALILGQNLLRLLRPAATLGGARPSGSARPVPPVNPAHRPAHQRR
jgi:uncharacterized protein